MKRNITDETFSDSDMDKTHDRRRKSSHFSHFSVGVVEHSD